jgi:hypothetical protein
MISISSGNSKRMSSEGWELLSQRGAAGQPASESAGKGDAGGDEGGRHGQEGWMGRGGGREEGSGGAHGEALDSLKAGWGIGAASKPHSGSSPLLRPDTAMTTSPPIRDAIGNIEGNMVVVDTASILTIDEGPECNEEGADAVVGVPSRIVGRAGTFPARQTSNRRNSDPREPDHTHKKSLTAFGGEGAEMPPMTRPVRLGWTATARFKLSNFGLSRKTLGNAEKFVVRFDEIQCACPSLVGSRVRKARGVGVRQ